MSALTVVLAVLAAFCNATSSVLQRRAAAAEPGNGRGFRESVRILRDLMRQPYWVAGAGMLAVTTVLQAAALSVGSLALVQPLMASELLFTLAVGSVVFRHRPDLRTWLAFAALAVGLSVFLVAASPSAGQTTATPGRWLLAGGAWAGAVVALFLLARPVSGAPRAMLLGLASAVSFSVTAALLKEVTGRFDGDLGTLFSDWPPYATALAGAAAFLLLQGALHAGTLAASAPALTLGDALASVALGWGLFDERIALGVHVFPEVIGAALIFAGSIGLAHAPSVSGHWDTATGTVRNSGPNGDRRPDPPG